jgi:TPP-dependent indolepyruvate ferredoxin oxidoreductase alpha subunit
MNKFLATDKFPYCKGCGHHFITKNTALACEKMGLSPQDVILVTDIGCHGIADKCFATHTIHGIHGRSTALATGIRLGVENPDKKIIVFIGDGGATIGLQHLIDASRLNVDITVILHNNLLYGMTGLKISKSILDQMTAASKVQYRFPAEILPALCEVTQDFEPLRILAESCGFEMVDQQDARKLKIMRLEEEKRNIEEEIERLKGEADE